MILAQETAYLPIFSLGPTTELAPEISANVFLGPFYLTDFNLAGYIPKTEFLSMMVLVSIDMMDC